MRTETVTTSRCLKIILDLNFQSNTSRVQMMKLELRLSYIVICILETYTGFSSSTGFFRPIPES